MSTSRKSLDELTVSKQRLSELADASDDAIDTSDIAELDDAFWDNAHVRLPTGNKTRLTVRFDEDVVQWFKDQGPGYQTRMNAVLRSYFAAHQSDE